MCRHCQDDERGLQYELTWATLLHLILLLIRPASIVPSFSNKRGSTGARRLLAPNDSIRTMKHENCNCRCNEMKYIHTLVPQQIEHAAKYLGLSHKVYGDFWLLKGGCLKCEETWEKARVALIAKAEEE